jgi:hypothetical protein
VIKVVDFMPKIQKWIPELQEHGFRGLVASAIAFSNNT